MVGGEKMTKNSTVKLGNVPFSSSSNTRYKVGKSATFSKTFSGCTYIRLTQSVKIQATPAEISMYNFIEITDADGLIVRGFIQSIDYINNLTCQLSFKIDGWETWKDSITFKKSYIERLSAGMDGNEYAYILPEPYTSNRYTCYAQTQYSITGYKYIIATLHFTSEQLYEDSTHINANPLVSSTEHLHKIDSITATGGTTLNGIYHGCAFVVADDAATANKLIAALIQSGYESSILNVFSVPATFIAANGTETKNFRYCAWYTAISPDDRTSSCTILSNSNIMSLLGTVAAPAATCSDLCKYKKIKNSPYTFLRILTPAGNHVDFDYDDFTDDEPIFGVYSAIGFNSELLLVPLNFQGVQYNFHKAISVQCNQTGMFSSSAFAAWAESQQLKYISTAVSALTGGVTAAINQNYTALAYVAGNTAMSALNYAEERSIASKSISTVGNVSNSDFAFCHPESSCFKLCSMSIRPQDAKNLSSYIENFGYTVSMYDVPDTNFIDDDCYIKCNNVQLSVNCPDSYAAEIRDLFNSGCKFI